MDFVRLATELYPSQSLTTELRSTEPLLQGLRDGRYNVIILPFKPTDSALIALPFGKESLYFNLPKGIPRKKLPPFLFPIWTGLHDCLFPHRFWKDLIKETMPHSRFLLQEQRDDFFELEKASSLPSFITDRVLSEEPLKNRTAVPIVDQSAQIEYSLVMTKKMGQRYPLFTKWLKTKNKKQKIGSSFWEDPFFCLDGKGRQDGGLCHNAAEDIMLIHYSKRILRLCRQRDNGRNWSIKIAYKRNLPNDGFFKVFFPSRTERLLPR